MKLLYWKKWGLWNDFLCVYMGEREGRRENVVKLVKF